MSTLRNLVSRYAELADIDVDWLELLTADWQLLADLALGDVVLWAPTIDGDYIAVAHSRPAGSVTLFYRDVLGDLLRDDWRELVEETVRRNTEMFQQAMKMFTPFANAAPPKETRKAEPKDLDELKEQLRALQTKLDNLS